MEQPFRIVRRDSFQVVGYKIETTNQKREGTKAIPAFWEKFNKQNMASELAPLMSDEMAGIFGINVYNVDASDSRRFDYYIAVASDSKVEGSLICYTVPAAVWAVFPCTMDTIAKSEVMAITKWLPKFKYKPLNAGYITGRMKSGAPDIEYYGKDGQIEVWIAVKDRSLDCC